MLKKTSTLILAWGMVSALLSTRVWAEEVKIRIIHTNDLHSSRRLPELAKAISAESIEGERQERVVLKFDAGDWFSGTLDALPAISEDDDLPVELAFFEALKYDAVTIGNHEFDPGLFGFNRILHKAFNAKTRKQFSIPLVGTTVPHHLLLGYPDLIVSHVVLTRRLPSSGKTIKIAVVGAMGVTALKGSKSTRQNKFSENIAMGLHGFEIKPLETLEFIGGEKAYAEKLQQEINIIRRGVDLVVLLFHGGSQDLLVKEDEELLGKLHGVDILIAGHTHQEYFKQTATLKIPFMQAGHGGREFGVFDFTYNTRPGDFEGQRLSALSHSLHPIVQDSISQGHVKESEGWFFSKWFENKTTLNSMLEAEPCKPHLGDNTPMGRFDQDYNHKLTINDEFSWKVMTTILRGLNTDKRFLEVSAQKPLDLYFSAIDLSMRGGVKGNQDYTYGEIVEAIAGEGFFTWMDKGKFHFRHGFPVVTFYLTGYEISTLISALVGTSRDMMEATPTFSRNVSFQVRARGIISGRLMIAGEIKDLKIDGKAIEYRKLYHVGTSIFLAESIFYEWARLTSIRMLGVLVKALVGLDPKNAEGKKYDLRDLRVLHNLAREQYLPTEYQAFGERFADKCGVMDDH